MFVPEISNSKPVIADTEGRLATIYVFEDTLYQYNFSANVSDPNINDNLSFGYTVPDPFTDDTIFAMDFISGIINFTANTNDDAGLYDFTLVAEDTEADSDTKS